VYCPGAERTHLTTHCVYEEFTQQSSDKRSHLTAASVSVGSTITLSCMTAEEQCTYRLHSSKNAENDGPSKWQGMK